MNDPDPVPVRQVAERLVFDSTYLQVFDDDVVHADGRVGRYLRARTPGPGDGVVIVPRHGELLGLVLTYRYATGAWEWGFPRGYAHSPDPRVSARAELAEETGLTATDLTLLGVVHPNSGLLADGCAVFVADVPTTDSRPTDRDEVHGTRWSTHQDLLAQVGAGDLRDGFTLSALTLLAAHRAH